jgi:hypothetical protein
LFYIAYLGVDLKIIIYYKSMADDYVCAGDRKSKKQLKKKRGFNRYKKGGHERAGKKI